MYRVYQPQDVTSLTILSWRRSEQSAQETSIYYYCWAQRLNGPLGQHLFAGTPGPQSHARNRERACTSHGAGKLAVLQSNWPVPYRSPSRACNAWVGESTSLHSWPKLGLISFDWLEGWEKDSWILLWGKICTPSRVARSRSDNLGKTLGLGPPAINRAFWPLSKIWSLVYCR